MNQKQIEVAKLVGGMALLMFGRKTEGLALFGKGALDLEKIYKEEHPELEPGFDNRWQKAVEFYDETHKDDINRKLHMIGIPMILGGAIGLIATKPYKKPWVASAAAFGVGWLLNIVGHSKYEKNKPAFADDPLSFIAGPVWDVQQLMNKNVIENKTESLKLLENDRT